MSNWLSRKFLLTVGTALFTVVSEGLGWGISPETWNWVWGIVIAYLAVEGTADIVTRAKK